MHASARDCVPEPVPARCPCLGQGLCARACAGKVRMPRPGTAPEPAPVRYACLGQGLCTRACAGKVPMPRPRTVLQSLCRPFRWSGLICAPSLLSGFQEVPRASTCFEVTPDLLAHRPYGCLGRGRWRLGVCQGCVFEVAVRLSPLCSPNWLFSFIFQEQ
ncbi:hypothetical protein NDU88_000440 [Pleurodeles waltl]|uniref:Uncharacterized protein n=1 Tax=Pleurodeles waltl TaxID=8319 RepID=A0AAV7Q7C7_PLEWA|nr:hypothetical protein NDU88_000440 [Pleurodeles waltl]